MQYNLHCKDTNENLTYLKVYWFDPTPSIHEWCLYIDSYLEKEWLSITISNLTKIEWLFVTEKPLKAKELDYLYTLRNVQYRIGRFTREIKTIIKWL